MAQSNQTFAPADPGDALVAVVTHADTVIVDLDETLYLRNSTEDYLDCAWPALPASLLLRVLDVIKPWRWHGGDATRDIWRIRLLRTLMPWIDLRWRQRVAALATAHTNRGLLLALQQRTAPTIVATLGFKPIVEPLIAAIGLPQVSVVAMSWQGFGDRQRGKLPMVQAACGTGTVERALVLTDSLDDRALLAACAVPLRVIWPQARYRRALAGVYLPGLYTTLVKRPGERHILRSILQEDFALWVFATLALATQPLHFLGGLLFLLASFWIVYEMGYVDNDEVGARFEQKPKLSANFHERPVATPAIQPWLWAIATGAAGLWLVRWPGLPNAADAARWMGMLIATLLWFRLYNRMNKATRIWMFPGLQFARAAAVLVVVPATPIGAAVLAAHTLARWVPYFCYRLHPGAWPDTQPEIIRLVFLVVIGATVAATGGISALVNWSALGAFSWCVFRSRRELRQIVAGAHRIDQPAQTQLVGQSEPLGVAGTCR